MKTKLSVFAVTAAILAAALPLRAEDPLVSAQNVIERQIDAFLRDDAAAAYALASPSIQEKFPDQAAFIDMVRRGYPPVYRPGNYAFGRSKVSGGTILQEVLITGSDGKDWTAIYQIVHQPDGSYKVNGVHMQPAAAGSDI